MPREIGELTREAAALKPKADLTRTELLLRALGGGARTKEERSRHLRFALIPSTVGGFEIVPGSPVASMETTVCRGDQAGRNLLVAFALGAYRLEHGRHPE